MSKYKIVIFDLDGTLLDTSEGVLSSVRYVIKKKGLEALDDAVLRTFIGPPIQRRFKEIYQFEDEEIAEMASMFRNHYKDIDLLKAKPYEGLYRTLKELYDKRISIAVATYKRQDYTDTIMHHFKIDEYTDNIYGSDFEGKYSKKDIISLCLNHAGIVDLGEALMIGDTENDAIGAEELGVDFLAVKYGFGFKTTEDVNKVKNVGSVFNTEDILKWF